jgi:hypothetical protein
MTCNNSNLINRQDYSNSVILDTTHTIECIIGLTLYTSAKPPVIQIVDPKRRGVISQIRDSIAVTVYFA